MERLIAKWPSVQRADNVDAYVRRIMVNHFLSGKRKRKRGSRDVVSHDLVTSDRITVGGPGHEQVVNRDLLVRALAQLPERQRIVLVLRYVADQLDSAIAEALGCNPAAVRAIVHRGLVTLRSCAEGGTFRERKVTETALDGACTTTSTG